jgi:hypothetical protein
LVKSLSATMATPVSGARAKMNRLPVAATLGDAGLNAVLHTAVLPD